MSVTQTRRAFLLRTGRVGLAGAGLALLGGCVPTPGQGRGGAPGSRVATIGFLSGNTEEVAEDAASQLSDLRQGLRDLGWVEGENLRLEVRLAQGDPSALPDLAAQLVGMPVDVIVTQGGASTRAAVAATRTLPIVMIQVTPDPVAQGWAASIQRPGGNVTGLLQSPSEIAGKRVELLREVVPHVSQVAYVAGPDAAVLDAGAVRETARTLGVQVDILTLPTERDLELAFAAIDREGAEAVFVQPGAVTNSHRARIVDFMARRRLPAMYSQRLWVEGGGLMSYGNTRRESYGRAAFYVDRILRGARPGDLPIEYPTQYELVINLRTAAALGLTIPDALLAQATEVIR